MTTNNLIKNKGNALISLILLFPTFTLPANAVTTASGNESEGKMRTEGPSVPRLADATYNFNLPEQPLSDALKAIAQQTATNILYEPTAVQNLTARALKANLTANEAISRVLTGTHLTAEKTAANTILVAPEGIAPSVTTATAASGLYETSLRLAQNTGNTGTSDTGTEGAPNAGTEGTGEKFPANPDKDSADPKLQEIIVSAQKRSERLQDVPVPVTAVRADGLVNSNQLRLQDYFATVPGLSLSPSFRGEARLAIRGIAADLSSNPTVGITVDDVPYGGTTSSGGGFAAPDIDPSELSRVEVLRGPQGALYGASSMGGLLKFVTVDPSTAGLSGRLQAGLNSIYNGDDVGYSVRGSVNVPLSDTMAVRASGFSRRDPGYIDDPSLNAKGVNELDSKGGRISARWQPSDAFTMKLSALLQDVSGEGSSLVYLDSALGDLEHSALRGTGDFSRKTQAYAANFNAKFQSFDVVALTGYSIDSFTASTDYTPFLGAAAENVFQVGGAALLDDRENSKFTQELRMSVPLGQRFEWLFGTFYADEDSKDAEQEVVAVDPSTGAQIGSLLEVPFPTTYKEYAVFTDLTFHVTDRFDVQFGGRESRNKQTYAQILRGPVVGEEISSDLAESKDSAFTYLVTPRFKVTPELMLYARLASGYRPGGPNINTALLGLPPQYDPDTTQNYEIGVKGDLFDRTLSFDASLYYIDWKDIQLVVNQSGLNIFINAGRAKSQGLELSAQSRPLTGMTVAGWVTWSDAVLTEDFPTESLVSGSSGDRLPNSSRFSGNISLDQEFPLVGNWTGLLGGTISYVGDRLGEFTATSSRQGFGSYAKADVRAGLRFDTWTMNLYINNVADKRGVLGVGLLPSYVSYIQPRTAGLSLAKSF